MQANLALKSYFDPTIIEDFEVVNRYVSQITSREAELLDRTRQALAVAPEETINALKLQIQNFSKILQSQKELGSAQLTRGQEVDYLDTAFEILNLEPMFDVKEAIESGDIVEIYSLDAIQLYRNLNFFKYCSYSLVDLLMNEWFVLYERPQIVTDTMMEDINRVIGGPNKLIPYTMPEHILFEKLVKDDLARQIKMKKLGLLKSRLTGAPAGLLSTCKVKPVSHQINRNQILPLNN